MGFKREMKRKMKKGKKKGSYPFELQEIRFDENSYHVIHSIEELHEAFDFLLRIGCFRPEKGQDILLRNNVYMDYDLIHRTMWMCRTHTAIERKDLKRKMLIRAKKFHLDYEAGKVITENMECRFGVDDIELQNFKFKFENVNTHAFPMEDEYIKALYLQCESARRNVSEDTIISANLPEEQQEIIRLNNVKDGLFKALLLDSLRYEEGMFVGSFKSILLLK